MMAQAAGDLGAVVNRSKWWRWREVEGESADLRRDGWRPDLRARVGDREFSREAG